jgi:hypothetical protein
VQEQLIARRLGSIEIGLMPAGTWHAKVGGEY